MNTHNLKNKVKQIRKELKTQRKILKHKIIKHNLSAFAFFLKRNYLEIKESYHNLFSEETILKSFFIREVDKMEEHTQNNNYLDLSIVEATEDMRDKEEAFDIMEACRIPGLTI